MYQYSVKVRKELYLWGSAGIGENMPFPAPLMLHIQNDILGESVSFGTESIDGTRNTIGTLKPGECFSIPIQNIRGVFADCALDSSVICVIAAFPVK
jgi:hypothetical protein